MNIDLILIIALAIYFLRTSFFYIGVLRQKRKSCKIDTNSLPIVSVIIPARNEVNNIENCLRSVAANNYPGSKFEIIAVNDRSSDGTGNVLSRLSKDITNLKIVTVNESPDQDRPKGKPGALEAGISLASGEVFLFTDADCTVHESWIMTHATAYCDSSNGLTASFTNIKGRRLFDYVQATEWVYMHTMACGGLGLGIPLGCFGNNMSVSRRAYESVGGYKNIKFSVTEDLALLEAVFNTGAGTRYLLEQSGLATTLPCPSFSEYIAQKKRWAIGGLDLGWRAVFFVLSSIAVWTGFVISVVSQAWLWLVLLLIIRIAGDFLLIQYSVFTLKLKRIKRWVLPSVVFFMIMELVAPFLVIKKEIVWKGQRFSREH